MKGTTFSMALGNIMLNANNEEIHTWSQTGTSEIPTLPNTVLKNVFNRFFHLSFLSFFAF